MNRELPHAPDGYEISADRSRLDAELIHEWLSQDAYWAMGRSRQTQDLAIANSLNFGAYRSVGGAQAGYARVVTDYATFAVGRVRGHVRFGRRFDTARCRWFPPRFCTRPTW